MDQDALTKSHTPQDNHFMSLKDHHMSNCKNKSTVGFETGKTELVSGIVIFKEIEGDLNSCRNLYSQT